MIWDKLLGIVLGFLEWVLGLMPEWTDPDPFESGPFRAVGAILGALDRWVNVDLLMTVIGILLAVYVGQSTVAVVVWLYDRIPAKFT